MALKRYRFNVFLVGDDLDGPGRPVEVMHADMMRAELSASRYGLQDAAANPVNISTMWIWCALVRTGETALGFQEFSADMLIGFDRVPQETDVNPTRPDPLSDSR